MSQPASESSIYPQSTNWERVPRDDAERAREFAQHGGITGGDKTSDDLDDGPPATFWEQAQRPLLLFVATCASTYYVNGPVYCAAVITILLCHEFGHYFQARRYRVAASLPYFIPLPLPPLGTMGAVISMSGRIPNRKALFDIGISGPLAGLVPALICSVIGLRLSAVQPVQSQNVLILGDPLIFRWIAEWFSMTPPPGYDIYLHPLALAGWAGIFVTALNLIPIGQLDGGHILYAILRKWSYPITTLLLYGALATMILTRNYGWSLMVALLVFFGPNHPPTHDDSQPLGRGRTILGWITLMFIIIGFTPVPIRMP